MKPMEISAAILVTFIKKEVGRHDSGAADLERVTDYVEEKEVYTADFQAQ